MKYCLVLMSFLIASDFSARAQERSWVNAGDGAWDDPESWSPAGTPAPNDTIIIGNAFNKTITFGSSSGGRTISNLTLFANGFTNTLFLDNAGTDVPLQIMNNLLVQQGGALVITNSSIQAIGVEHFGDEFLIVNGTVELQSGALVATNRFVSVGFVPTTVSVAQFNTGTLIVSGGLFLSDAISVGGFPGAIGTITVTGGVVDPAFISLGSASGSTGILHIAGGQLGGGTHPVLIGGEVAELLTAIFVGDNGYGRVIVSDGLVNARMVVGGQEGSIGEAIFDGGSFEGEQLDIGFHSQRATAWVTGQEAVLRTRFVFVGGAGLAQMIVSNGVVDTEGVSVGVLQGLPGEFIMAGGQYRSRPITFSDGSTLELNHFSLGLGAGSTGTLWVTGENSL